MNIRKRKKKFNENYVKFKVLHLKFLIYVGIHKSPIIMFYDETSPCL